MIWRAASFLLAVLIVSPSGLSQKTASVGSQTGSIRGVVVDPSPALVPNARIELKSGDLKFSTSTNGRGEFALEEIPAVTYELSAEQVGFFTTRVRFLRLAPGEVKRLPELPLFIAWGCWGGNFVLELPRTIRSNEVRGVVFEGIIGSQKRPSEGQTLTLTLESGGSQPLGAVSDAKGEFRFPNVPSGRYRIRTKDGLSASLPVDSRWDTVMLDSFTSWRCPDGGCNPPPEVTLTVCE